ncbi:hypothetical protein CBS101457_004972 [Exobasidium rhododendri]|nr:hypothetical protein CBS101457_004972 [Exobasidium rhododendri]
MADTIDARDISTTFSGGTNNEGEAHGPIVAPAGSVFTATNVGSSGEQIAAYWTQNPNNQAATQAFIMIHGKLRDGDTYWSTMSSILSSAMADNTPGVDPNSIIVAPEFFSTIFNSGQYSNTELGWDDVNGWQAGDTATHPSGTTLTSFDALDALVEVFANTTTYPAMKNVTVVGHGGGGQLNQRYAMVAKSNPPNVHVRYIHGDPSSCAYFTTDRPTQMNSGYALPSKASCQYYNTWRYGFDNFTGFDNDLQTPQQYFQQYITRDVISIVGLQDVMADGDTYCMANMQGGSMRRDRNLAWWQYVNTLARTNENLYGFPATYDTLPDWSNISANAIQLQLVVVENADHNAGEVFGSSEGRAALFSTSSMPTGWRPDGWTATATTSSGSNSTVPASSSSSPASSPSPPSSSSSSKASSSASSVASTSSATANAFATPLLILLVSLVASTLAILV